MAQHQKNRALRLEPIARQRIQRLEEANHGALIVNRAAPINISVLDRAREGVSVPVLFGADIDRHDILVRH